ncbi:ABC transporter substrate-binding protein [Aminobacter aminovorans]|uniref:ABC transporter substrate-binding protein n=1 Tax=Aminobacter aminovorans TaxID=83263 RepID=A0AAC8YVJ3_AMIAI|nr:ABC transporter substrate-binding protein [Aminobacter aminovorans]AMS45296.1 ABC transporter substrate-binding protein [Aminobacter aminovorans]MBB3704939.1 ABC-type transport system substrate-binding protein [Aminobacter aminovorans]
MSSQEPKAQNSALSPSRRDVLAGALAAVAGLTMTWKGQALAGEGEKVLRVAMTVSDIPLTTGQPSQGTEGIRFIGTTIYDSLIAWDLSSGEKAATLRAGLAESWSVDANDKTLWTLKLRKGVTFHDGSEFNADAVVWNFDKLMKKDAPQFDQAQSVQASQYYGSISSWSKVDDNTVQIRSKKPDAAFPYSLVNLFFSSPKRWEEVGGDWNKFASQPSGTGPWVVDKLVPRERIELKGNQNYWDEARRPKSDRLVLLPMPDANTRVAALLAGQVDFVEAPPPDAIPRLQGAGMQIVTNAYPHVWCYEISTMEDSAFHDVRVRQAANLAIDRDGMVALLGGLAIPAKGMVNEGHPWFGNPTFKLRYDPDEAKKLLAEAGYGPDKPAKLKIIIAPSGSGQMQPIAMNELIKENYRAVGIDLEFEVLDWETLRGRRRAGAFAPENKGRDGVNNSWAFWDPDIALLKTAASSETPPTGYNWGKFTDAKADELVSAARNAFDAAEQDKILAELHAHVVDQAMWVWAVHDLNPRALAPNVKGFVQAQSWLQDLTPVVVE